jgi:hypothetical protein
MSSIRRKIYLFPNNNAYICFRSEDNEAIVLVAQAKVNNIKLRNI